MIDKELDLDKYLEESFITFMTALNDDIQLFLGDKVPFMLQLDVKIAVQPRDEPRIKEYHPKLSHLLSKMPNRIAPVKTATGKEEIKVSNIPLAPEMKTPEETKYVEENDL